MTQSLSPPDRGTSNRRFTRLLVLLALTVFIPTITMLWLLDRTSANERSAVEQRFRAFCQQQLNTGIQRWDAQWRKSERHWLNSGSYGELLQDPLFASAALVDGPTGAIVFPIWDRESASTPVQPQNPLWTQVKRLEFDDQNHQIAAQLYAIIESESGREESRLAWQGRIRCLAKGDHIDEAVRLWKNAIHQDNHPQIWESGLFLLGLDIDSNTATSIGKQMLQWIQDEKGSAGKLPVSRRLFVMAALENAGFPCPTRKAEEYFARLKPPQSIPDHSLKLIPAGDGIWKMVSPDRRSMIFIEESNIRKIVNPGDGLPSDLTLHPPGEDTDAFMSRHLSGPLSDWKLALNVGESNNPFLKSHRQSNRLTLWTAWLAIVAALLIGFWLCRAILEEAKLNRLKNDFLAAVSHELKTPVTAIGVLVDNLLQHDDRNVSKTRDYLGMISRENERLSRLIDNFLSFSRMERHKHRFHHGSVTLQEIVSDAAAIIGDRYPDQVDRINNKTSGVRSLFLEGDREALTTVMVNLIENAMKYSQEEVCLEVFADDGNACLRVSDQGVGMTPDEQRQVFKKFYRADQSLTNETSGVGLGLSIVDFIVSAHSGHVTVESKPGRGSRFTVSFPMISNPSNDVNC